MTVVKISEDLKEMVPDYIEKCRKEVIYLKDYMFQKRYVEVGKKAHAMKGVLGSMGFQEGYETLVEIEKRLASNEYGEVTEKIEEYSKYLDELEIEYVEEEF